LAGRQTFQFINCTDVKWRRIEIGAFVEIQKMQRGQTLQNIESYLHLRGVTIEETCSSARRHVINDSYRAQPPPTKTQSELTGSRANRGEEGASIGSGATILAKTTVGENAIVGRSVVTKDVRQPLCRQSAESSVYRTTESLN